MGAALLERGVVEIGVGPGGQDFEREGRGLGQVARNDPDFTRLEPREQPLETCDVHRLAEAIGDRLADQRMVRDLTLADQIFGACNLVGKDRCDQVFGSHAGELRRDLLAAAEARQRQRNPGHPTPAGDEHRCVEQRFDQQPSDTRRMQVARNLGKIEAVRPGQRQHDVVFGRRRLQLEIEFAAKPLAQRQPPGTVEAAAIGRMDDQLHAADFVEEALDDQPILGR